MRRSTSMRPRPGVMAAPIDWTTSSLQVDPAGATDRTGCVDPEWRRCRPATRPARTCSSMATLAAILTGLVPCLASSFADVSAGVFRVLSADAAPGPAGVILQPTSAGAVGRERSLTAAVRPRQQQRRAQARDRAPARQLDFSGSCLPARSGLRRVRRFTPYTYAELRDARRGPTRRCPCTRPPSAPNTWMRLDNVTPAAHAWRGDEYRHGLPGTRQRTSTGASGHR